MPRPEIAIIGGSMEDKKKQESTKMELARLKNKSGLVRNPIALEDYSDEGELALQNKKRNCGNNERQQQVSNIKI